MVEVLVVGLDSMDRTVASELMTQGRMPNLAGLCAEGIVAEMANPIGMLTYPVWPTISTGVHPTRTGRPGWRALRPGTYRVQFIGHSSQLAVPTFWERLVSQGRRCTVVDVPFIHSAPHPDLVMVCEWSSHDRRDERSGFPEGIVEELCERFPLEPVDSCEALGAEGHIEELHAALQRDIAQTSDGLDWILRERPVDVFTAVLGAPHCAGHQYWHLHDERSVHRDPDLHAKRGDLLADIYEEVDAALGRLLEAAAPTRATMVVLSHGMSDNLVMPDLIEPVARAIDDAMGSPPLLHSLREHARRLPRRAWRSLYRRAGGSTHYMDFGLDGSRRWMVLESFPSHGALRLNVVGREPNGRIRREDVSGTIDHLERELLALRDADTGAPVVERVIRMADHYDVDDAPLPDVVVEWSRHGLIGVITSPTIGTIRRTHRETRSGAHEQDGLVVLAGPDVPAGVRTQMRSVDVWPTLASLLGVDAGDVDGEAIGLVRDVPASR